MANHGGSTTTELHQRMGSDVAEEVLRLETGFPHIAAKLIELWGSAAMDRYFDEIMLPRRDGRHGFPPEAASIIMRLAAIHQKLGYTKEAPGNIWAWAADSDIVRGSKH